MKTLIIMRHAKSDWDNLNLSDHDRTLSDRGNRTAPRMGAWLAEQGLTPDAVILSSAIRVQQTWAHVKAALPSPPAAFPDRALYMAWPQNLLEEIHTCDAAVNTLFIVNHEPTVSGLCHMLAKPPIPPSCARAFDKFPTAAIAELTHPGPWRALQPKTATFSRFTTPKDLT